MRAFFSSHVEIKGNRLFRTEVLTDENIIDESDSNPLVHKAKGLAAAILSSSMCNSSQFISPPLPGHLSMDMRWTTPSRDRNQERDRSSDDNNDLKRDINVDSFLQASQHRHNQPEELSTIMMTSSHYLRQEPEKTMIMMMMASNCGGIGTGVTDPPTRHFVGSSLGPDAVLSNARTAQKATNVTQ